MSSVLTSVKSLMQMFDDKAQEFISEIDNVHNVWLEEIEQEANRMFSRDFNTEPELMPKTPSQKKNSRRKRISLGRQEETQGKRRFSKGRRSNLRGSAVKSLDLIDEEENASKASTSQAADTTQSKRPTRKKKQTKSDAAEEEPVSQSIDISSSEEDQNKKPELVIEEVAKDLKVNPADTHSLVQPPPEAPMPEVTVSISSSDRLSAELAKKPKRSPGRSAAKIAIAGIQPSRRSSARPCHSLAARRHSIIREAVRRSSRRSMLKKKATRAGNSTCSSNAYDCNDDSLEETSGEVLAEDAPADTVDNAAPKEPVKSLEAKNPLSVAPAFERITRSMAANSSSLAQSPLLVSKQKGSSDEDMTMETEEQQVRRSSRGLKRKATHATEDKLTQTMTPQESQPANKPNMRSFLHTVQKNQLLMMTPTSLSRTGVKSFIKSNTPLRLYPKAKERHKLEALRKKQEQEEERMKRIEEEKKKKQEELKRKRDERLRRVFEAKVKEEQKEEEKKKRIEQKMAQIVEKNDKRQAEEKAKKKVALKRQEELELKKKLEEEAKKKEEETRQQEILAQKKAEEEELRARKLAEAQRALELEREREQQAAAAAERARVEKEERLALQREVERAAREKEMRELENKRKALEEKRKLEEQQRLAANEKALKDREAAKKNETAAKQTACLNTTVDIERSAIGTPVGKGATLNVTFDLDDPMSPQSYALSPKGGNKPGTSTQENYGMDQNSDDSTDDESAPRKQVPSWAQGPNLQRSIMKQYFNPPDLDSFFGEVKPIKLEEIFNKAKPRYFKRTSSAVWHSPLDVNK